jgi:hypothetical protein
MVVGANNAGQRTWVTNFADAASTAITTEAAEPATATAATSRQLSSETTMTAEEIEPLEEHQRRMPSLNTAMSTAAAPITVNGIAADAITNAATTTAPPLEAGEAAAESVTAATETHVKEIDSLGQQEEWTPSLNTSFDVNAIMSTKEYAERQRVVAQDTRTSSYAAWRASSSLFATSVTDTAQASPSATVPSWMRWEPSAAELSAAAAATVTTGASDVMVIVDTSTTVDTTTTTTTTTTINPTAILSASDLDAVIANLGGTHMIHRTAVKKLAALNITCTCPVGAQVAASAKKMGKRVHGAHCPYLVGLRRLTQG